MNVALICSFLPRPRRWSLTGHRFPTTSFVLAASAAAFAFAAPVHAQNLLTNGDFSSVDGGGDPTGWSIDNASITSIDTSDYPSGASRSLLIALPVNGGSSLGQIWQTLDVAGSGAPLLPNTVYTATVWVKSTNSGDAKLEIKRLDGSNAELERIDSSSSGTSWSQVQVAFNTGTAAHVQVLFRYAKDNTSSGNQARFALAVLSAGSTSSLGTVSLVPTMESIGVYAPVSGLITGSGGHTLSLAWRPTGTSTWIPALDGVADTSAEEFRGSILQLEPGTSYDVQATLKLAGGTVDQTTATISTWSDSVTVGSTTTLPGSTTSTYTITAQGTAGSWVRYQAGSGGSTINVGSGSDYALHISNASYVIIDGLTLKGGRLASIQIDNSDHIRIVNCDISDWSETGEFHAGCDSGEVKFGFFLPDSDPTCAYRTKGTNATLINLRAGIYVFGSGSHQILIERNLIHNPVGRSLGWVYAQGGNHPAGPSGIILHSTGGNIVIRDNDIVAGAGHFFNDVIEGKENGEEGGGVYRDTDISGNLLAGANDDGTELDGGQMNVRYWHNWVIGNHSSISTAPNLLGPSYVFRNIFIGGDEFGMAANGFKMGGDPGTTYLVNNTVSAPAYGFTAGNYHSVPSLVYIRNNIFAGPVVGNGLLRFDRDTDGDGNPDWLVIGEVDYDLYPVNGLYATYTSGWETHGVAGYPDYSDPQAGSYLLLPGSDGVGDSSVVSGIAASGDDLGAIDGTTSGLPWPIRPGAPAMYPLRNVVRVRSGSTAAFALELDAPTATGSSWTATPGESWISLSSSSGSTGSSPQVITATVNASSLSPGAYHTFVSVRTNTGALRTVLVDAEVEPATDILYTAEAEDHITASGFSSVSDSSASGGHYAHADSDGGRIEWSVNVATAGNYWIHARIRADAPSYLLQNHNSLSLKIDDTSTEATNPGLRWDFAHAGLDWAWETANVEIPSAESEVIGPFALTAGTHTLDFDKRESGVQLDVVALSNSPFPPRVATPAFSPSGGSYGSTQSVTITCATSGATIRYTTDGSTPTRTNGTTYSGAVSVSSTTVLKAFAYNNTYADSPVVAADYTIGGGGGGSGAFQMSGGQVVMEAEHFTAETSGDSHDWSLYTQSGASGDATDNAIQATPNNGTGYTAFNASATHVDYAIDVPSGSGGNYYVHLRSLGPTTADDSVYLSIDDGTTSVLQLNFINSLGWRTTTGTLALTTGAHTLTVWMREDGAIVDKIVLDTSSSDPTGTGPAESARSGSSSEAFQPDGNGDFVMEAEHYDTNTDGTDAWTPITDSSASGGSSDNALQVLPNAGTAYTSWDPSAAHLDYNIEVPSTGSYYVHVRDYGATSSDDSVYVSIDGGSTTQTVTAGRSLDWKSSPGTLSVPAGTHTLTIWEREDGTEIDKIVLSPSSTAPTGSGPAESTRN